MAVTTGKRPKLAVWKFSSCDGCQLQLLDLEDHLLEIADALEIAYFLEATRATSAAPMTCRWWKGRSPPARTPNASRKSAGKARCSSP